MHNQQSLNNYFATHWQGHFNQYLYSGLSLVKKIKPEEWVLDVGCGVNMFKPLIANLVGIDPAFDQADVKLTIEEFKTDKKFDVAFCLGSINFGDKNTIKNQIECVVNLLKPDARIFWRCNPGLHDHGNPYCKEIDFFPWTPRLLEEFAEQFNFKIADLREDFNNRIYCEWARSNT
jgi:hypothetical protein